MPRKRFTTILQQVFPKEDFQRNYECLKALEQSLLFLNPEKQARGKV